MSRTADFTIQGFIYQFNKTLYELLQGNSDTEVVVEGIIEDIEVNCNNGTEAIQCKYHEGEKNDKEFTLSQVYKPILQMMVHYFENNCNKNIHYKLYCYFPKEEPGETLMLDSEKITKLLSSNDQDLKKYLEKLKGNNISDFQNSFSIEFGDSLESLISKVEKKLEENGFSADEIDVLIYPNAIQLIADISINHDLSERRVKKSDFISKLKEIKTIAVTRWTLALKNYKKLMEIKKKQLNYNLAINSRLRYFVMSDIDILDFEECVVNFIKDYLDKYHFKPYLHNQTPVFCLDCPQKVFDDIRIRLHKKGVKFVDGYIAGTYFDEVEFFREPIVSVKKKIDAEVEFRVRLLHYSNIKIINKNKCDDLFIISTKKYSEIDYKDITTERIELNKIDEIKYILGMRKTYE